MDDLRHISNEWEDEERNSSPGRFAFDQRKNSSFYIHRLQNDFVIRFLENAVENVSLWKEKTTFLPGQWRR